MKTILALLIFFSAIALPALGELTDADLNEIRLIVKEEVKPIKADIVTLKTDVAWIRGKFEGIDKRFEGVNQRITRATNVSYGLIALIVAAIALPQIIMAWRSRKDRSLPLPTTGKSVGGRQCNPKVWIGSIPGRNLV